MRRVTIYGGEACVDEQPSVRPWKGGDWKEYRCGHGEEFYRCYGQEGVTTKKILEIMGTFRDVLMVIRRQMQFLGHVWEEKT